MSVERERRGRVEIVTINRPEARNAINYETSAALADAFDAIEADDDVWAVVLTGAGDKAFCAGMDLKAFAGGGGNVMGVNGGFAGITNRDFPKALIAAVNGHALAGGFEIMLACDMVVASEDANFGIPEVRRGLVAGAGGIIRLAKRVSLAQALELGMTGDPVDAQTAKQMGLVNRVVAAADVLPTAIALAERICEAAPLAVRATKQVIRASLEVPETDAWKLQANAAATVFTSPDAREGALAFAEKRAPNWVGHLGSAT
ncbi:MAG TPA: crotonase/enoyl-CoA hydratase family protein [Acidimicrobiales bacterium]|nr:crotonase/enoyl-CoA hydratase family protein [Acidimicrobiales bacterium]